MTDREIESRAYRDNPLMHWPEEAGMLSTVLNILVTSTSRIMPLKVKNSFLRLIGIEIGEDTAIALGVQMDIFFPEKISIGKGTVIGYGTTVLTHETTTDRFSKGYVEIGDNVLIGAKTTVLPGVKIEDGATVSANSLVNRDVKEGEKVGGVPVRKIGEE